MPEEPQPSLQFTGESQAPQRANRLRQVLVALLVALPLVPILAGILITASSPPAEAVAPGALRPLASRVSQAPSVPGGPGALVAFVRRSTLMRRSPGGRPLARVGPRTEFGSPRALWVVQPRGGWLGVVSPQAGNGRLGWIPQGAASLSRVDWQLKVSLSRRQLIAQQGGRIAARFTVAIGRPSAPTPTGRFAVTDRLQTGDPSGPYGCCILALSALSPHAIQGWGGGNRIAIHSTPEAGSVGEAVSHGCVRLTLADGRWLLAHVPLGTPTLITA